jgi:hypothetical protein
METNREEDGSRTAAVDSVFVGPGEMLARCRRFDWESTPLGPVDTWPTSLQIAARICLSAPSPMAIFAGPVRTLIYNDGYKQALGPTKHPEALGRPAREILGEIWDELGPKVDRVFARAESIYETDEPYVIARGQEGEEPEEAFLRFLSLRSSTMQVTTFWPPSTSLQRRRNMCDSSVMPSACSSCRMTCSPSPAPTATSGVSIPHLHVCSAGALRRC